MNTDDDVVALLRDAALVLPGTQPEHLAAARGAGRQLRRRRRAAAVVGAGTAGLVIVVGMTSLNVDAGHASQTVVQPAAPASVQGKQAQVLKNEKANLAVLLKALGSDWRAAGAEADSAAVEPREGSNAAQALPDRYTARATMMLFNTDDSPELSLASVCKPFAEKGTVTQGCTELRTSDGRTAYYAGPGPADGDQAGGPWSSAMYYFGRPDGSFVRIEFAAGTSADRVSAAQQQQALGWMDRYQKALVSAVSDDGVRPQADGTGSPPQAPMITDHDRDLVQMQRELGVDWTLYEGKLALEPNWPEYKELPTLPHGYWAAPADITTISRSAFDAACGAKDGAAACEKRTAKNGLEVYVRSRADRDATSGEYVGESAAYLIRDDGSVLLADVELKSVQETKVHNSDQVAGMRTWLANLQGRLIQTVAYYQSKG
jgi:hypothetical protein